MAKILQTKKNNAPIYPVTNDAAVIVGEKPNGTTLRKKIEDLEKGAGGGGLVIEGSISSGDFYSDGTKDWTNDIKEAVSKGQGVYFKYGSGSAISYSLVTTIDGDSVFATDIQYAGPSESE